MELQIVAKTKILFIIFSKVLKFWINNTENIRQYLCVYHLDHLNLLVQSLRAVCFSFLTAKILCRRRILTFPLFWALSHSCWLLWRGRLTLPTSSHLKRSESAIFSLIWLTVDAQNMYMYINPYFRYKWPTDNVCLALDSRSSRIMPNYYILVRILLMNISIINSESFSTLRNLRLMVVGTKCCKFQYSIYFTIILLALVASI